MVSLQHSYRVAVCTAVCTLYFVHIVHKLLVSCDGIAIMVDFKDKDIAGVSKIPH